METLFNTMVMKDLKRMNELVRKGWFGTTDFNEAVLSLSNSLAMYHQEVTDEGYTKRKCIPKGRMARGA